MEVQYDNPNRCIKDDLTVPGPCVCPACMEAIKSVDSTYVPKGMVLTDANLAEPNAMPRIAYHFICLSCKKDNIADYMSYCPDCGIRVIIRSHKVIEFLQYHATQNQRKK